MSPGRRFRWPLKKGIYLIDRINIRDPWSGNYFIVPKVAFAVPANGKAYYVGTLRANAASERTLIGSLSGKAHFSVENRIEEEKAYIQSKFNASPGQIDQSLMVFDEKLPQSIDNTQEYNDAMRILNALFYGLSTM